MQCRRKPHIPTFCLGCLAQGLLLLLGTVSVVHFRATSGSTPPPSLAFSIVTAGLRLGPYLSPDGLSILYNTRGNIALQLRTLNSLQPELLPGTEENTNDPCWSPDPKWLAY